MIGGTADVARLDATLSRNEWLAMLIERFDAVALPDAWLVAGAVAQTVWNTALGRPPAHGIKDVDIVYFDPADLSAASEAAEERRLRALFSEVPAKLDVKNEARVHLWYEQTFGYPIARYTSTADAVASFPTTATSIAVRRRRGCFECCAPFGLGDLFALVVRPNRRQVTEAIYRAKIARWRQAWPELTFLGWEDGRVSS